MSAGCRAEIERLQTELAQADADAETALGMVERLRVRIVSLLRCHYEEHQHGNSPTCFDIQSPSDEWENAALAKR